MRRASEIRFLFMVSSRKYRITQLLHDRGIFSGAEVRELAEVKQIIQFQILITRSDIYSVVFLLV